MKTISHHILIVDDDPILQAYLEINFTQQNYKVTPLGQGEGINNILQKNTIDLIILDVMLTGKDGFYWLKWLQVQHPHIDILILSAKKNDTDRIQGLELGAVDYLPKPFHIKELTLRVANILQRSSTHQNIPNKTPTIIKFGEFQFNTQLNTLTKQNQSLKLTYYEAKLLSVLCQHQNQVVTRNQLAQALNGQDHSPLDRRIDVHINHLRNKIEANPSTPLFIRTTRGKGYQFHP